MIVQNALFANHDDGPEKHLGNLSVTPKFDLVFFIMFLP